MKCPTCPDATLTMSERKGIEIDYCPQCRGVWLDRGELDKLIERSGAAQAAAPDAGQGYRADAARHPARHDSERSGYGHKPKKSWLHELFD